MPCLRAAKIASFPVKFPVSRESPRRQVRSALRHQPALKLLSSLCKQRYSRQAFWACLEMGASRSRIELNGVVHPIDHIGLSPWLSSQHIPRGGCSRRSVTRSSYNSALRRINRTTVEMKHLDRELDHTDVTLVFFTAGPNARER
jgi:hypothetical protein